MMILVGSDIHIKSVDPKLRIHTRKTHDTAFSMIPVMQRHTVCGRRPCFLCPSMWLVASGLCIPWQLHLARIVSPDALVCA